MITHFADVTLKTVSIQGVKQFYHGILRFPISREGEGVIQFRPTPDFTLTFEEAAEPIAPAHLAFQVPYTELEPLARRLAGSVPLLEWPDGRTITESGTGKNVYFRDGDGHLLELIAHPYLNDSAMEAGGDYRVLYLREVGLPFEDPVAAREWMKRTLGMSGDLESEQFAFAIGGTAHAVVVSTSRRWIPIGMYALRPSIRVMFGVTGESFIRQVRSALDERAVKADDEGGLRFDLFGYDIRLKVTPSFPADLPARLNLPHAIGREDGQ